MVKTLKKIESQETELFMKIGYPSIDHMIGGMALGESWLIAGRSSMGKSALALNCAFAMARAGYGVAYVSVEGTNHSQRCRLLSMYTNVPLRLIRTGKMNDHEVPKVAHAAGVVSNLECFYISDNESRWDKIKANIQTRKIKEPKMGVVFIDHIGLITVGGRYRPRQEEVSFISADAKRLAVSANMCVVMVCQLNREVEKRKGNHRPVLSDLRESGSLEQDADVVLMLYRPSYYGESKDKTLAEIGIVKNREGMTGTVEMHFTGECVRFGEREKDTGEFPK